MKQECPRWQQSPNLAIFSIKVTRSLTLGLGVIWKGVISGVNMPNMKSLHLTVQKLWTRLKFLATESQTDRTKTICPRFHSGGIKIMQRIHKPPLTKYVCAFAMSPYTCHVISSSIRWCHQLVLYISYVKAHTWRISTMIYSLKISGIYLTVSRANISICFSGAFVLCFRNTYIVTSASLRRRVQISRGHFSTLLNVFSDCAITTSLYMTHFRTFWSTLVLITSHPCLSLNPCSSLDIPPMTATVRMLRCYNI